MRRRIGFMQGRLSPLVDGRIQSFPWSCWEAEFALAERSGLGLMEWTLDQERLYENPLLTRAGQEQIRSLSRRHAVAVPSLTGDCFMQAPFWKVDGAQRLELQRDFLEIAAACAAVGITMIVVPLVDNGRLDTDSQKTALLEFLTSQNAFLQQRGLRVVFESDLGPHDLAEFIAEWPAQTFGINYDIGNSASLGFDPQAELEAYGERVCNVHIKDRLRAGTTVPLGTGNADFDSVFAALGRLRYTGNYILQTARATDGNHALALTRYADMAVGWLERYAA